MNVAHDRQEGHHLTFRLAGEQYAISIKKVREIIEYDSVRPVPGTPPDVRGVINLRGAVVPVIDLALKFGLDETPISKDTCIIILDILIDGEPGSMGIMTEAVSQVLELQAKDIEHPPAFGTQVHVDYLVGMAMVDGRMALVLDIDDVLHTSEILPAVQGPVEEEDLSSEGEEHGWDEEDEHPLVDEMLEQSQKREMAKGSKKAEEKKQDKTSGKTEEKKKGKTKGKAKEEGEPEQPAQLGIVVEASAQHVPAEIGLEAVPDEASEEVPPDSSEGAEEEVK